ncbi:hypothetical protein CONPUDRAFT_98444 [Coniophora puteana RWD-64-598 SS2]|uniref:Uncharacterized protein n=1 Tax=Coniophora puteana (strain RWD-64-598) TaxID=741705 RepID=A0A5M3N3K1_CONPW|nr:uncharacterized protein CONPUDRAFT_98444 [Coniophora puteana RWD-64-598 SS2]EIW85415.1 hypothetical protein CONPUDRAFT_98444 [Coniophora puteana RWD-64-598 SS2]
MARLSYSRPPPYAPLVNFGKRWGPSLGIWGFGAGTAAVFLLSVTPVVKNGLLVNLPLIGSYYEDKTPACDKPF